MTQTCFQLAKAKRNRKVKANNPNLKAKVTPKVLQRFVKAKGKGDSKVSQGKHHQKTDSSSQELASEQTAQMPCIYFAQGKCYREKCPFKHEASTAHATAKATPKPQVAPAKPGLVALLAATVMAATASLPPTAFGPMFLDFVGDTGAGEWLGSRSAFHKQGIGDQQLDCWVWTVINLSASQPVEERNLLVPL